MDVVAQVRKSDGCTEAPKTRPGSGGHPSPAMAGARLLLLQASMLQLVLASVSFVAVGDWGGHSDFEPTTKAQIATAVGMARVAKSMRSDAVMLLGDNFYEAGVRSSDSWRFHKSFEDVYRTDLFESLPFLVVAGNHDHRGSVAAQVSYHDAGARWHFPDLFYTRTYNYTSKAGRVRSATFIMIDTVVLVGLSDDGCRGCELPGPADALLAEDRWAWVEEQLKSRSDFVVVAGHYPIYSAGNDGTTRALVHRLLPLLSRYGAHYLSGHDHMLEHLSVAGVEMYLAGAGRECCYGTPKLHTVPPHALKFMISGEGGRGPGVGPRPGHDIRGGFLSMSFDEVAAVSYYDEQGVLLYSAPLVQPRKGSQRALSTCSLGRCYALRFQRCEGSWTLEGLWPVDPVDCEGPDFDELQLPPEIEAWRSCESGVPNRELWARAWRQGRCSNLHQKAYFQRALDLYALHKHRCDDVTCGPVCFAENLQQEELCAGAAPVDAATVV